MSVVAPKSFEQPPKHLGALLTSEWYGALSKIFSNIIIATNDFYKQKEISPLLFPITTGSVSSPMGLGSDSTPVEIIIKGNKVYLADSMQFSLEIGARLTNKGAFYIMPSFRGESVDKRHLNEFFHSEAEIIGTLSDVQVLVEEYIKFLIKHLLNTCDTEIREIAGTTNHLKDVLNKSFISIRFEDAIQELSNVDGAIEYIEQNIPIITSKGEQELIKRYGQCTWLTNMPWISVPFYQAKEQGTSFAMNADLLAGIGEMLGSGQRVLTKNDLTESLNAHNCAETGYEWYGKMREIKTVQTSGFGLGIERFILFVLKHDDIRDCQLLLRDHSQITLP